MRIGEVLKGARTRQGLEMRELEDRTKIRTKYLRALESEAWDVLPGPAYAKGFLRTYSRMLGLDADAIVDEYVRQVESRLEPENPLRVGEPVIEGRRRGAARAPGRFGPLALVAAGVTIAAAIFLVLGLIGDDEGGQEDIRPAAREGARKGGDDRPKKEKQGDSKPDAEGPVDLHMSIRSDVQVCLLGAENNVLIASQVLTAGTEENFTQPRFLLRFPSGFDRSQFELELDGDAARLPQTSGAAAFTIEPGARPRALDPPGKGCP
jgi:transcriptional regulator with XRE-family HTH domain